VPLAGWRDVEVTERRTAVDFAYQMNWLVDEACPDVKIVCVVLDNLNVHARASLYVAFAASEARRIAKKLEFHFTPTHGSWLNVAECELAMSLCKGPNACIAVSTRRQDLLAVYDWDVDRGRAGDWLKGHIGSCSSILMPCS